MTLVSDRFESDLRTGDRAEIVTPEGVPLVFTIASIGERAFAFMIDALCIAAILVALALLLALVPGQLTAAFVFLAFFLLRNGWFTIFELRDQGRTPGKRRGKLRVIDSRGGALQPISLVVRNLTRELEIILPLVVLGSPEIVVAAGPGWVRALAALWVIGIAVMPLIDKRNRRLGDLLAGTIVVRDPRRELERDLADREDTAERGRGEAESVDTVGFTTRQLEMYGVYELQVLERLLRDEPRTSKTLTAVAVRVVAKIGWEGELREVGGSRAFLESFYSAQRARLEHDLSLGRARERKKEGRLGRASKRAGPGGG